MASSTERLAVSMVAAGESPGTRRVTITWTRPRARALARSSSLTPGPDDDCAATQPTRLSTSRRAPARRDKATATTGSWPRHHTVRSVVSSRPPMRRERWLGGEPGRGAVRAMTPDESGETAPECQAYERCRDFARGHGAADFATVVPWRKSLPNEYKALKSIET